MATPDTSRADHNFQRFFAISGVPFFVFACVGWLVLGPGPPRFDITAQQTADFFISHGVTQYLVGLTLFEIAFLFQLFWTVQLGVTLWKLEGGTRSITLVAIISGLTVPIIMLLDCGFWAAAVYRAGTLSPDVLQGLNDAAWFGAIFFWPVMLAFYPLTGYLIRRSHGQPGALPRWTGTLTYVLAPTQILWLGGVFTKTGPFAMDGILGYWVPLAAWGIQCLTLSVAMFRVLGPAVARAGSDPALRPHSSGLGRRDPTARSLGR